LTFWPTKVVTGAAVVSGNQQQMSMAVGPKGKWVLVGQVLGSSVLFSVFFGGFFITPVRPRFCELAPLLGCATACYLATIHIPMGKRLG
jgi:hypothetical protein